MYAKLHSFFLQESVLDFSPSYFLFPTKLNPCSDTLRIPSLQRSRSALPRIQIVLAVTETRSKTHHELIISSNDTKQSRYPPFQPHLTSKANAFAQTQATMDDDYGAEPVRYLDVYPKLPTNTPIGHPHIIDLECLDHDLPGTQSITIADLVVTVLFKFTPGTLTSFLDLERPKFLYMEAGGPGRLEFCIKRDGRMVIVRVLRPCDRPFGLIGSFRWDS